MENNNSFKKSVKTVTLSFTNNDIITMGFTVNEVKQNPQIVRDYARAKLGIPIIRSKYGRERSSKYTELREKLHLDKSADAGKILRALIEQNKI